MSSCCVPNRVGSGPATATTAQSAAGGAAAARVFFPAGQSFVGTDLPQIPQDGEGPKRQVKLRPFWLDITTVTNARFADFVAATGYVTDAERFGWSPVFRGLLGAYVPARSRSDTPWWVPVDGACWSEPEGPGSNIVDRPDHPVVQVSWGDAKAFAGWCGGRLPSEAEWEHAARGGLADPRFPWGDAEPDDQTIYANIWQGQFPHTNSLADGYLGASPVRAFPPNGAGLFGMAGNVWEWTGDPFRVRSLSRQAKLRNDNASEAREKVLKGGSFLCHISYRYRSEARSPLTAQSCASNTGFRLAYDA